MMDQVNAREFGQLEAEVRHLRQQLAEMEAGVKALGNQMRELQSLLSQVQGARWTLGALVTVAGILGSGAATLAAWMKFGNN